MAEISRRALLGASLLTAGAAVGAGLGVIGPVHHKVAVPPAEPPAALVEALTRQRRLLVAYREANPADGSVMAGLLAGVAAHCDALRALLALYPGWRVAHPEVPILSDPARASGGMGAMCIREAQQLRQAVLTWPAGEQQAERVVPVLASISASLRTQAADLGYPFTVPAVAVTAAGAGQRQQPVEDGLQQVLAAQQLAVYGYPLIGVHLEADAQVARARDLEAFRRLTRDAVDTALVALGVTPAPAAAQYPPPTPVTSAETAAAWGVRIEEQSAAAYRYLLECAVRAGGNQAALRGQALDGLTVAALAATDWRRLNTPARATVAFPGTGTN